MRKRGIVLSLIALFFVLSCSSKYDIKTQTPAKPNLDRYKKVYIGWLDLHEGKWRNLGYKSPGEWSKVIRELNVDSLQAYCRGELSGRTVTGSRGADAAPAGSLYIKPVLTYHDVRSGLNRIQYLHLNLTFTDTATGAVKYSARVIIDTAGFGFGNYTLEGQLNFGMKNLAGFIASKF